MEVVTRAFPYSSWKVYVTSFKLRDLLECLKTKAWTVGSGEFCKNA